MWEDSILTNMKPVSDEAVSLVIDVRVRTNRNP